MNFYSCWVLLTAGIASFCGLKYIWGTAGFSDDPGSGAWLTAAGLMSASGPVVPFGAQAMLAMTAAVSGSPAPVLDLSVTGPSFVRVVETSLPLVGVLILTTRVTFKFWAYIRTYDQPHLVRDSFDSRGKGADSVAARKPDLREIWSTVLATRDEVLGEYGEYETDPLLSFQYPLIHDIRCPATAAFFDAQREVTNAHPGTPGDDTCPRNQAAIENYQQAVQKMSAAWRTARDTARRVGISGLPEKYHKNVNRAISVLRLANDSSLSAAGRANHLRTAVQLVEYAISNNAFVLPDKTRDKIEDEIRLALPSGGLPGTPGKSASPQLSPAQS
jgi:hypothetical protein